MQTKTKKLPMRMCVGCREMKPKKELIRVVREAVKKTDEAGSEASIPPSPPVISLDFKGKKQGRGAYICPCKTCLQKARKIRALQRALECDIPDELFERFEELLEGGDDGP